MESNISNSAKEYPGKKNLNKNEDINDIDYNISILTNLTRLSLNEKVIEGVYLYGCDIEEENNPSSDFNPVNIMRTARKLNCFQDKIKEYVTDYYISGLVLMGRPIRLNEPVFSFYLKIKKINEADIESGIIDVKNYDKNTIQKDDKIYKFKFKRKNEDLLKMKDKSTGDALCVANYSNISLGKILKRCGYRKDRSSRKILYYNKDEVLNAKSLKGTDFFIFPALKAVCESYEGGIFMKLLPKKILKTNYTYADYFYSLESQNHDVKEVLEMFKEKVINKRAMKTYNQAFIKIEDVIYDNPYNLFFEDKNGKKCNVGEYFYNFYKIDIPNEDMPIAVRIIDKGGKLKGKDRSFIHIPCYLLEIIGNIFGDKISVKDIVQRPDEKLNEIQRIRRLIEQKAIEIQNNYLGNQFDPLIIEGQIIRSPLIIFDNNIMHETKNGSFDLLQSSPYSKTKDLKKIDIYLLDLDNGKGSFIWDNLKAASIELGITFKEDPTFYPIKSFENQNEFEDYINKYFLGVDEYYSKKENETDFIFMFMDSRKKTSFHYKIFKSIINKFNWSIPTQVILFDEKKFSKKTNLSQFTNILCQMWAKKGNELYICDFSFIPKTIVVAYSSMAIKDKKVLTSISISIGTKLYEYMFYSEIGENNKNETRISPSIGPLLSKALITIGKHLKKHIENILIYRDAVNERQQKLIHETEIDFIKKAIEKANEELIKKEKKDIFSKTKWCLILVSKINEIKMFLNEQQGGNNYNYVQNIPVGTIVDNTITNKDKFDFYLNSADSKQGTCSSTHYTVLYDDTKLKAIQIYKLTYYLTYLSYNTTKSIKVPAPLYFVSRRNKFTSESLRGDIVNPKFRTLNISL